jgi:hypothetical protein
LKTGLRKRVKILLAVGLLLSGRAAAAQILTVSGSPAAMTITSAIAGSDPTSISNSSTTYTAVVVIPSHITAALGSNMPSGVTLTISLAVAAGATSSGPVALDVTARNVVTNVTATQITQAITYNLSALASAGVIASQTRIVTLTLVTGP